MNMDHVPHRSVQSALETQDCVARQKPFGRADRKLFGNTMIRNSSDCCDELIITLCVSLGGLRWNWPLE